MLIKELSSNYFDNEQQKAKVSRPSSLHRLTVVDSSRKKWRKTQSKLVLSLRLLNSFLISRFLIQYLHIASLVLVKWHLKNSFNLIC